jgi:tetratricopeptide (TPR) repeat protein
VTPRLRVTVIVGCAAAAAAAGVVALTLATRQSPAQPHPRAGKPPLALYEPSPAAPQIRRAVRSWPDHTLTTMERLARQRPRDPAVQFNLALARLWAGYDAEATAAFRTAKRVGRDTWYEIKADNVLHPQYFAQGYPPFLPTTTDPLLRRGAQLQALGRQHSAERLFARAARLRPADDEAQVAAAVGRFDMDDLGASFSRLGPLTRRFPRSQSVRYHLALLLAWTGQRERATAQFRRARALGPKTILGREANQFLLRLETAGTK